jgi:DNA polymerase III subunit delta'
MTVWDDFPASRVLDGVRRQVSAPEPAHAWLLLGPRGSGKRTAATAIAAALDCRLEPGIGCGTCSDCARARRHRHPDVHYIVPEGLVIPVDVIREAVIPEADRPPFESPYKVFVVEEADRMNDAAQNALLKTLEEPLSDTVFILISDNEEELLDTLRSRCRIVHLEPVPEEHIVRVLEVEGVSSQLSVTAARVSEGDLQRARDIVAGPAHERRKRWVSLPLRLTSPSPALDAGAEVVAEARAAAKERERVHREEVVELAEAMGEGRGTAGARNALAKRHRRELKRVEEDVYGEALSYLASFYKDVVALRAGARTAVVNVDATEALEAWAGSPLTERALLAAAERCLAARASFAFNANQALAIEATLVDLTRLVPPPAAAHR